MREFPTLQLFQDLEALARVQRQLEDAASQRDASALEAADALQEDLLARLAAAPRSAVDVGRAALGEALRGWYGPARAGGAARAGRATPARRGDGAAGRRGPVRHREGCGRLRAESAREAMAQGSRRRARCSAAPSW